MAWPKGKPRKAKSDIATVAAKLSGANAVRTSDPGIGQGEPIDPSQLAGRGGNIGPADTPNAGEKAAKPRKKGTDKPSVTAEEISTSTIQQWTDALFSAHLGIAAMTGVSELTLDTDDAENLAKAAANVARWYETPKLAQKTIDWYCLLTVIGAIYVPRVKAFGARKRAERRPKPPAQTAPKPPTKEEYAARQAAFNEALDTTKRMPSNDARVFTPSDPSALN